MKSKKRHQSSEDDSEDSDGSARSSSSESESEESSASEHRHRKKKKRADSSDSDSDSDDHRRSKKRKHKKKKKKHVKRKRRSNSVAGSRSDEEDDSSISDGEVSPKKKHKKHKHKRSRSSSASVIEVVEHKDRRLHSVVKERRRSSEEERPARTYYQKEYRSESPADDFERQREREVQRFYRGSSKERRYHEQYHYDERQRNERFEPYQQAASNQYPNRYTSHQSPQFKVPNDGYQTGQRDLRYRRNPRFEGQRPPPTNEEYQRRPREVPFHSREQQRGFNNRYNQYQDRGPKRNYEDGQDNRERERRAPPEADRYRGRENPDRRERFQEDHFHSDRTREVRRDKPAIRGERPPPPPPPVHHRNNQSPPQVAEDRDRYRDRNRRTDMKEEREPARGEERGREVRGEDRSREVRGEERSREPRGEERNREPRGEERNREPRGEERSREMRGEDRNREARGREPRRDARPEGAPAPRDRDRRTRFAESEGDKEYSWGKTEVKKEPTDNGDKEKPNFGLSGKLTADANTVNGVVIKYTEPDDAKQPKRRWRFYPFKGDKALPILYIHRQSAFLIGRDKKVCDITLEHPSISKQHAALQYRATPFARADGSQGRRVRPYVIDLESANGTFVNNKKIEGRRYIELLEKDVVKFGFSQREYVLLHENSKDDAQDDDNQETGLGANVTTTDQIKKDKRIKEEVAEDGD